jgi:hypothetical protein
MLIAISGSQGSGKTTIINELKKQQIQYGNGEVLIPGTVERKTSRSILSDWNVTLQEVNNNPELTLKFQNEIIQRKYNDEQAAVDSPLLYYTERTYADLFVYALISLGKDNTYSDWLNEYYKQCMLFQQSYEHIYYLKAGYFNVVGDGIRGDGKHYSRMVDLVMLDYTKQMSRRSKIDVIQTPDIEERVAIIATQCKFEWLKKQ